jgi:nicotinamidase-related amidase
LSVFDRTLTLGVLVERGERAQDARHSSRRILVKTALLVVDVQQSFQQRPYWREDDVRPFLGHVQKLIDNASASGIPVLQVFHCEEDEGPTGPFSSKSGHVKTLGSLRISPTEVFYKTVHSGLYGRAANGRSLEQWLRDFDIGHVVVTGIRTEQCCETTTRHASDAGFKVTYAIDATLTFPMVSRSGRTFSPAELMERTELVLNGRFADVRLTEAIAF